MLIPGFNIASSSAEINENDGIWTDTFQDNKNVTLINCEISDGSVMLKNESGSQLYDYNMYGNKAYSYETIFFSTISPPSIHIFLEDEFTSVGYPKIRRIDNDTATLEPSSSKKIVIHHFRFKINQDIISINQIDLQWYGRAENDQKISMYYWQPIGISGIWEKADAKRSNGNLIELRQSYAGNLFISSDNYIDICIVTSPETRKKCTLSSDYTKVAVYGQKHASSGFIVSSLIQPQKISSWEMFTWEDYKKTGTTIKYHVLDENGILIDDAILHGNSNGFTMPVSLQSINASKINKIRIKADLDTSNSSISPEIHRWSVTWQTEKNTWKDMFSSTLRISKRDNVDITDGNISLMPFYNDWAMFGQNPANTRASDGYGPYDNTMYWYSHSTDIVGGGNRNSVIKNGVLYIASSNGSRIYAFNSTVTEDEEGMSNLAFMYGDIPEYTMKNSPAVADNLVIIATGSTSSGGVENKVYALDIENNLSVVWDFKYGDINPSYPNICYYGSPVISNDKIFLSSWSGDMSSMNYLDFTRGNNKIITLDMDGNLLWDRDLPAGSISTPAVYDNMAIVGCESMRGDSVIAFNIKNGEKIWGSRLAL